MSTLFDPVPFGALELPNRLVMSPMGRGRTTVDGTPLPVMAEYYAQRAAAGLVISEATHPSAIAVGHAHSVRLCTAEQARAWAGIVDRVHRHGGRMYLQIMHAGRISHPDLHGETPLAPSAVPADGTARVFHGKPAYPVPRPMTEDDIARTVEDFARCARTAAEIGFDGVEIHGANGYLLHQFLASATNRRTDAHGGDVAGRIRFAVDVARAVVAAVGPERVGMRLSPGFPLNDMTEPDRAEIYPALLTELGRLGIGHVHFVAGSDPDLVRRLSHQWERTVIVNGGTGPLDTEATLAAADRALRDGADLLSFGRQFLANPDLPDRLRTGAPLNAWQPPFFYEGGACGYTDYPVLSETARDTTAATATH